MDQGLGIPKDDLPRVFERFHRGRNVDASISGSGVGLASAHRLVELHGGTLSVESEEGRGSAFTVRLPRGLGVPELESQPRVRSS
jgi:signal transduction histidine kinase